MIGITHVRVSGQLTGLPVELRERRHYFLNVIQEKQTQLSESGKYHLSSKFRELHELFTSDIIGLSKYAPEHAQHLYSQELARGLSYPMVTRPYDNSRPVVSINRDRNGFWHNPGSWQNTWDRVACWEPVNEAVIPQWLLHTVAVSADNPTHISWAERPEDIFNDQRRRRASVSKFLSKMRHKFQLRMTLEDIQTFSEILGSALSTPDLRHELVSGADISRTYREKHFGSCMYNSCEVSFYDHQDCVQMLRTTNADGDLVARNLVWTLDDGTIAFDRVYPTDEGRIYHTVIDYCLAQGWGNLWDSHHPRLQSGYATVKDVSRYPYLDSMNTVDDLGDGHLRLRCDGEGDRSCTGVDGEPWFNDGTPMVWSDYQDTEIEEDDATYVDCVSSYVDSCTLDHDFTWWKGDYYQNDEMVTPANHGAPCPAEECVYSETIDEYLYQPERDSDLVEAIVSSETYASSHAMDWIWTEDAVPAPNNCMQSSWVWNSVAAELAEMYAEEEEEEAVV